MPHDARSLALVLALAAAAAVAGCGGGDAPTDTTAAATGTNAATLPTESSGRSAPVPEKPPSKVGRLITLPADSGGRRTTLAIRVAAVVDPLHPTPFQRRSLTGSNRFVGVRMVLVNRGARSWSGAPADMTTLVTNRDTQARQAATAVGDCGGSFAKRVELGPHQRQRGCLVFVLPKHRHSELVQVTTDPPLVPPGQWTLR
jgi:hypothetical protein